jgi:hypothetical protein
MTVDAPRPRKSRSWRSALAMLGYWLLAAYFAVSQPALCLCELAGQPLFSHLHSHSGSAADSHSEDHAHLELLVLVRANAAVTVLPEVEDAATLLRRLQSGLLVRLASASPSAHGWQPSLEPPPPRVS